MYELISTIRRRAPWPLRLWSIAALLAALSGVAQQAHPAPVTASLVVLTHVAVVDTVSGGTQRNMTVVISGERIAQVGRDGRTSIPAGTTIVDASAKFLVPGLWDMHVHTFFGDELGRYARDILLPLLVANGVTGVRDMGSDLAPIIETRKEIAEHRVLGPRMVIAGPMLDGPATHYPASMVVASPAEGRTAVRRLKATGVDFIKVQSLLSRDAYFAIVDESKKQHLPVFGHVLDAVRLVEALNAGQKGFEHLIGVFEGSSAAEDAFIKGAPKGPGPFLRTYDARKEAALTSSPWRK